MIFVQWQMQKLKIIKDKVSIFSAGPQDLLKKLCKVVVCYFKCFNIYLTGSVLKIYFVINSCSYILCF
jgi:hypothetical protein